MSHRNPKDITASKRKTRVHPYSDFITKFRLMIKNTIPPDTPTIDANDVVHDFIDTHDPRYLFNDETGPVNLREFLTRGADHNEPVNIERYMSLLSKILQEMSKSSNLIELQMFNQLTFAMEEASITGLYSLSQHNPRMMPYIEVYLQPLGKAKEIHYIHRNGKPDLRFGNSVVRNIINHWISNIQHKSQSRSHSASSPTSPAQKRTKHAGGGRVHVGPKGGKYVIKIVDGQEVKKYMS